VGKTKIRESVFAQSSTASLTNINNPLFLLYFPSFFLRILCVLRVSAFDLLGVSWRPWRFKEQ
jgi:hypothetical protein